MRILSKFQDYYDSAGLVYGVNTRLVYERHTKEVNYSLLSSSQRNLINDYIDSLPAQNGWKSNFILHPGVIGFCGKLYPVYKYSSTEYGYNNSICFTDFSKFAESKKNLPESMFKVKTSKHYSRCFNTKPEAWCFEIAEQQYVGMLAEDIFYSLNVPIFCRLKDQNDWVNKEVQATITVNPILKYLRFQHRFEPITAFQEVSMYIASLYYQNENKEYIVGDDKIIAESKGHSIKESFRQTAPTKKQKRKLNKKSKL